MQDSHQLSFRFPNTRYELSPTGDIRMIDHDGIMINSLIGNALDGGPSCLWLRIYKSNGDMAVYPLRGSLSNADMLLARHGVRWQGRCEGVDYSLTLVLRNSAWFWKVELAGSGEIVDLLLGQDLGMAEAAAVRENELYAAQYLAHSVFASARGPVICSRQNLPQSGRHPFLQCGMLEGNAVGYLTDGVAFFGPAYRKTGEPQMLMQNLPNHICQSEYAYVALQSNRVELDRPRQFSFYFYMCADHAGVVESLEDQNAIQALYTPEDGFVPMERVRPAPDMGDAFYSDELTRKELDRLYPERCFEEMCNGQLMSFFTPDHAHVVLACKEELVERPHMSIVTCAVDESCFERDFISTTVCMAGQFGGHTVIGNTNRHKLFSAPRGMMNQSRANGLRLYIRLNGKWRLLTMPAIFEMGMNYARWHYVVDGDVLTVTTFCAAYQPVLVTQAKSRLARRYDFRITGQVVMGTHEYEQAARILAQKGRLTILPAEDSPILSYYPKLSYVLTLPKHCAVSDDRPFFSDGLPHDTGLLTLQMDQCTDFALHITGILEGGSAPQAPLDFEQEKQRAMDGFQQLTGGFELTGKPGREAALINETLRWFAHNAMIHFAVPHGLEQPGGAAWGTRDVCQGPFEFFLSFGQLGLARRILLKVFSRQRRADGQWPQWFMFDRYPDKMEACHGDVVFWPLKCVADYLLASGDESLMRERLPFDGEKAAASFCEHLNAALDVVQSRFLPNTDLISYDGGDWNDTLQPAQPELKARLSSSWTQALAYQVMSLLGSVVTDEALANRCRALAERIRRGFREHMMPGGVIAGFLRRKEDGSFTPLMHPLDASTGIRYRLIPMTRAIVAGLLTPQEARSTLELIENRLHFPDGVRLMDHPPRYHGGVCRLFQRAELAANVGREISLQYTHAHIRYGDALGSMGDGGALWTALTQVNPLCVTEVVLNALPRQRNMYFSSSDGCFADRYDYERHFDGLMNGTVPVKGGWRLYSSGAGIYTSLTIRSMLGLRLEGGYLIIDPVLPRSLDGLVLRLKLAGREMTFHYQVLTDAPRQLSVCQYGRPLPMDAAKHSYRWAGGRIPLFAIQDEAPVEILLS